MPHTARIIGNTSEAAFVKITICTPTFAHSDKPRANLRPLLVKRRPHECTWPCRGVQRSGDARGTCLIVCPLPNSSIEECEKCKRLKYVKTSVEKKTNFAKLNQKLFQKYFFVFNVLVFDNLHNLLYSVGLGHTFMNKILQ